MEVIILIKYGLNEQVSIDITRQVLDVCTQKNIINIINIKSKDFKTFAPTFFPDVAKFLFFSCKINDIEKKWCYIDDGEDVCIDLKKIYTFESQRKIIIHTPDFTFGSGGIICLHYLAQILSKYGYDVYLYPKQNNINPFFNKFYNENFVNDNTPVIYPEIYEGNILKAKKVIRWILAPIGIVVKKEIVYSWNKNDLVYYFNDEQKIKENPDKKGSIYKMLSIIFLNPLTKNKNNGFRKDYCYTIRKTIFYKNIIQIHPSNAFKITNYHNQITCIDIFNNYKFFVCYDPLSFFIVIAAICGCVPIIYPIEGVSKKEWINTLAISDYCKEKGLDNLFGIAYGVEDIDWAKSTLHLVEKQWKDIIKFNIETNLKTFVEDLNHLEDGTLQNTVENNYFK
jgi:hypothetical protein